MPFYDRSELIGQAIGTLRTALIEEIILVTLAHVLFLMHVRSILIVTIPLPLAVLISFLGMKYVGISSTDQWRPGMTLDRLRADMGRAVQMPGVSNSWTMPIINRIDMLTTGVRSEVGVKIFGSDQTSVAIESARHNRVHA